MSSACWRLTTACGATNRVRRALTRHRALFFTCEQSTERRTAKSAMASTRRRATVRHRGATRSAWSTHVVAHDTIFLGGIALAGAVLKAFRPPIVRRPTNRVKNAWRPRVFAPKQCQCCPGAHACANARSQPCGAAFMPLPRRRSTQEPSSPNLFRHAASANFAIYV